MDVSVTPATDFDWQDLGIDEQEYGRLQSQVSDIYQKVNRIMKRKDITLDDIDFELN
jgi:type I restriction enzyme R subunit